MTLKLAVSRPPSRTEPRVASRFAVLKRPRRSMRVMMASARKRKNPATHTFAAKNQEPVTENARATIFVSTAISAVPRSICAWTNPITTRRPPMASFMEVFRKQLQHDGLDRRGTLLQRQGILRSGLRSAHVSVAMLHQHAYAALLLWPRNRL